MISISVPLVGV